MRPYSSVNPATGEEYGEFAILEDSAVNVAIARADSAYRVWSRRPVDERAAALSNAAALFRADKETLGRVLSEEMGKPLAEAIGEVSLVASIFDYYATQGPAMLEPEKLVPNSGDGAIIRMDPIGVLLGIMPWNFPYYQIARLAAPNLLLGNTILLKHARNCPRSALAFEKVLHESGFPHDAYINVFIDSSQVQAVLEDDRVQGVSLTGSEAAGASVGAIAGRLMKKMVLELGGSDPFIVLDDADLSAAVQSAVVGRMSNAGQTCTAAKRFLVTPQAHDEFVSNFVEAVQAIRVGNPLEPGVKMGPLSSSAAVKDLQELVDDAVNLGATVLTGGKPQEGAGNFYPPTVLVGVTPQMRAYKEELFGPVAVIHRVENQAQAVEVANDSPFGLGAVVFTANDEVANRIAEQLETGMVTINGSNRSQPDLPFGGVKRSGVGRELGRFGLEEFANRKLVRRPA